MCSENEKEATVKWIFHTCKIKWAFQRFTFDFVPMQYAYRSRSIFFNFFASNTIWSFFSNAIIECVRVLLCELWNYSIKNLFFHCQAVSCIFHCWYSFCTCACNYTLNSFNYKNCVKRSKNTAPNIQHAFAKYLVIYEMKCNINFSLREKIMSEKCDWERI